MTAPWPCSWCGASGFRNVAAAGCCAIHLSELYGRFKPEVWEGVGTGLQAGARRPDYGPEFADLRCSLCGATWVGVLFSPCSWCQDALERMKVWQAAKTLTPPDYDPDDRRYPNAMTAWAERLARAVESGIVTETRAHAAWRRAVGDVAA